MPGEEALALEQACIKLSSSTLHRPQGVKVLARAWLTSEIYHPDSPTGKAKALRFLLAWPSLEIHKAVMATEEFKARMGPIKEKCLPALYGRGMFHAEFPKENQLSK